MTGAGSAQTTFADLKRRRERSTQTAVHAAPSTFPQHDAPTILPNTAVCDVSFYPGIPADLFELKNTAHAGRSLFAKKALKPGTILMKLQPHVTLLDKASMPVLCSNCRKYPSPGCKLLRCSACQATFFCSEACQRAQWKPEMHKWECQRLQEWRKMTKAAGRPEADRIPATPIRAIGKLLFLKNRMHDDWWKQIEALAPSPRAHDAEQKEHLAALVLSVTQYAVGSGNVQDFFPGHSAADITKALLRLCDQFTINSFSLTLTDLTNIGVAICPTIALINHSCTPNVSVSFPRGPTQEMHVVAFQYIQAGQEVLSSYIETLRPQASRQKELYKQYRFNCLCSLCDHEQDGVGERDAVSCATPNCDGSLSLTALCSSWPVTEITCIRCGRSPQLDGRMCSKLQDTVSNAEAILDSSSFPDNSEEACLSQYQAITKLLQTLKGTYRLKPGCHPLLSLTRLALDKALHEASYLTIEQSTQLAESVDIGLSKTIGPDHPVSAIHHMVRARLQAVEPDPERPLGAALSLAAMTMRAAYNMLTVAFGPSSLLAEEAAQQVAQIQREAHMAKHHGAVRSG